jgi:hypothetical protein
MTSQQIGALWIMSLGVIAFASSFVVSRLSIRNDGLIAMVGSPILRWLCRILGGLLFGLGLTTYLR